MGNTEIILLSIPLIIVSVLLTRELNSWYWKINERIELQKKQNMLLQEILSNKESNEEILESSSPSNNSKEKEVVSIKQTSVNDPQILDQAIKNLNENDTANAESNNQ